MRLTTSIFRLVHYRKDARRIGYVGQVYREVLHQFVEILELPVVYFPVEHNEAKIMLIVVVVFVEVITCLYKAEKALSFPV